jgi:hypothetical protein
VSEETREEENREREREREIKEEEEENKKWVEEWKQTRTNSLKIGELLERILNTISDGVVAIFFLLVSSASLFPFSSIRASSRNS